MANRIHPTAIIGDGVELGEDNVIGPYSVLVGPATIGAGNWFGPHVTIGQPADYRGLPHPVGWDGELYGAGVVIGDRNIVRESVSITQGTHQPTTLGSDCYVMGRSWIAHDSRVDDHVTLTSSVQIAGHCHVWTGANLGLGAVLHQYSRVGPGAMIGMGAVIRKDVGAYLTVAGNPVRYLGLNRVGLSRAGCSEETIDALLPVLRGREEQLPAGVPDQVAELIKLWTQRAELR